MKTDNRDDRAKNQPVQTFWRVEGSLLNIEAVRPVAFFTWNAQTFSERWKRRGGLFLLALARPLLYALDRILATRVLHTLLRGVSRDRLDLLGEEYFNYILKPKLRPKAVKELQRGLEQGENIVLVSQGLEHIMRPLARHLGIDQIVSNRLEFRDGLATGRLLAPVIRPRQFLARIVGRKADGRILNEKLTSQLGFQPGALFDAVSDTTPVKVICPGRLVLFEPHSVGKALSPTQSLRGKNILLIGVTGFIGKVWLAKVLRDLPNTGKIFLLIRNQRLTTAERRFEKIVEESPVFDELHEKFGSDLQTFISERVEILGGDITLPGLGLTAETRLRLEDQLDLVVNSAGLTDFNPDLRQAIAINIDGAVHLLDFIEGCQKAALLHLSTCYVVGFRDGRINEEVVADYNPLDSSDYSARSEYARLKAMVAEVEAKSQTEEVSE
ncbi:MAG: SDR family oxidoreductase, partial [Acidobacteriota bacterium]